ncbi:MAG: response regulator transcription factor [Micrococcales bacterium]|nr:response regulator transcription factor [Micrococcales bacterium]
MIRMLLADDHDAIHFGVSALVQAQPDLELVATATSGEGAVELAGRHAPDVVLLDLSMPGRGGLWALREIRRRRPRTWLVVLTGDGRSATTRRALAAGADRFVLKDRPVEDLLLAVREAGPTPREPQGPPVTL